MTYRPEGGRTYDPAQIHRELTGIEAEADLLKQVDDQDRANSVTYHPLKAAMVKWNGAPSGVADPVVIGQTFNVDTVSRTGVGTYRVFFDQLTMYGINIFEGVYPLIELYMGNFTLAYQAVLTDGSAVQGWVEIQVFELVPNGQNLNRINRDMFAGDQLWFTATLNAIHPDAEVIPE